MSQLPLKLDWSIAQNRWKSAIDPLLTNPASNVSILSGVKLKTGVNVINHLLGQTQQGWYITDINAVCTVYRAAPFNNLTLTLTASGPAVVDIAVF